VLARRDQVVPGRLHPPERDEGLLLSGPQPAPARERDAKYQVWGKFSAGSYATPLTNVIKSGLMNVPKGQEEVQAALDEASLRETPRIEARTGYLAMLGNAAMLIGLFGTVHGLIGSFKAVAHASPADRATILAGSIGEAMNCTQFGLISSIPLLVMFSILNGRTQSLINDINESSVSVLNLIVQNRDKFKNMSVPAAAEE